jgi:hypothetical protein
MVVHERVDGTLANNHVLWFKSVTEWMVDEASQIQLDYIQKTLHDQQRRFEDVEQAIIDLAKRLEAIEQALAPKA